MAVSSELEERKNVALKQGKQEMVQLPLKHLNLIILQSRGVLRNQRQEVDVNNVRLLHSKLKAPAEKKAK